MSCLFILFFFFFFKQKTAYEMRISDWSSDVCSSDLAGLPLAEVSLERFRQSMDINVTGKFLCMKYQILAMIERGTKGSIVNTASAAGVEIGRASCRERVCQYV